MSHEAVQAKEDVALTPKGWSWVTLRRVTTHYSGGSSILKLEYSDFGIPVLAKGDVKPFGGIQHGGRFVPPELARKRGYRATEPGDYLLTTRDLTQDADFLGLLAPIPESEEFIINQGANVVRFSPEIDPRYIVYWCNGPIYRRHVKSHFVGSTQIHLRKDDFLNAPLLLPPLLDQRAIVAVLGALDDKRIRNGQVIKLIEGRLSAIYAAEFDHAGDGSERLDEFIEVAPDRAKPAKDELAPYVNMAALPTDEALVATVGRREPKSGSRFINGDTLMARITPCLENGKVAYVDCLADSEVGVGSTEFIVLRPRESLPLQLAYFLARSDRFRDFAVRHMSGSSGRQRCPAEAVERYEIRTPSAAASAEFASEAEPAFQMMRACLNESVLLAQLRNAILPRLLSGELRVRDAETLVEKVV